MRPDNYNIRASFFVPEPGPGVWASGVGSGAGKVVGGLRGGVAVVFAGSSSWALSLICASVREGSIVDEEGEGQGGEADSSSSLAALALKEKIVS